MNIKIIKTEQDYEDALKRFEQIFDAQPNQVQNGANEYDQKRPDPVNCKQ